MCCGSAKLLMYSEKPKIDQVIIDFDLVNGTFSFLDKQDMLKTLGMKPKFNSTLSDYLTDFFILAVRH
jgi:hypothetical protein